MPRGFESHALRARTLHPPARQKASPVTYPGPHPAQQPATRAQARAAARGGGGGRGRSTVARHGRLAVTSPARSIGKAVTLVAAVLVVTFVVLGGITWVRLWGNLGDQPGLGDGDLPPLAQLEGGANVLIIGSDSREGQGAEYGEGDDDASGVLNDVNILVHVSEDQTHATAVSIPRDTIVDTPACTNDKGEHIDEQFGVAFNSVLHEGGMTCVVAAAESLSGLDIQYAAMVQFKGVIEMSNAVGGVEVCVTNEISDDYVGLYLSPGNHTLQGADALKFLRSRHGVGDGSDLARISNQQVFLSALIRTVKSSDTLTNPVKLYGLASAVSNNMTLSSSLNPDTIVAFASALGKIPTENIVFAQLPVADAWGGQVEPLEPDASNMWALLRGDQPLQVQSQNAPTAAPPSTGGADAPSETAAPVETGPPGDAGPSATTPPDGAAAPTAPPTVSGQTADQQTCSNVN